MPLILSMTLAALVAAGIGIWFVFRVKELDRKMGDDGDEDVGLAFFLFLKMLGLSYLVGIIASLVGGLALWSVLVGAVFLIIFIGAAIATYYVGRLWKRFRAPETRPAN